MPSARDRYLASRARGHDVDLEPSEYAIEDLVKLIRIVGRTPGLERAHLLAHNRGTGTLARAPDAPKSE